MEKLFFIIPVYKVEDYLSRCVASVLGQTYPETEIVLVDDGSPDQCPAMCDRFSEEHENVTVIHKKNGGLSDARNAGLDYVMSCADGEDYVAFLDSDDFLHERFGELTVALSRKYGVGVVQCGYEKGTADRFGKEPRQTADGVESSDDALLGYRLKSMCWAKLYKIRTIGDVRFPVGKLNEDEFVVYRFVDRAGSVAYTNDALYYYAQHESSIMDDIARKMKNNPHRYDYLTAYTERMAYFETAGKKDQVMKTHEKVCSDIILRYCEQMYLKKDERDIDCVNGHYLELYREHYEKMIRRKGIPLKRKLMYIAFRVLPISAVFMGKFFTLRK